MATITILIKIIQINNYCTNTTFSDNTINNNNNFSNNIIIINNNNNNLNLNRSVEKNILICFNITFRWSGASLHLLIKMFLTHLLKSKSLCLYFSTLVLSRVTTVSSEALNYNRAALWHLVIGCCQSVR